MLVECDEFVKSDEFVVCDMLVECDEFVKSDEFVESVMNSYNIYRCNIYQVFTLLTTPSTPQMIYLIYTQIY